MPLFITDWKAWSTKDVVAGITVAVTSLPQYIAYAELAQLSGFRGIVASGPPLIALFEHWSDFHHCPDGHSGFEGS